MGQAMKKEETPKKKTGGLAGIVAGETDISAAGGAHTLEYRGYSIYDLAEKCVFEEVAFLLLNDHLPNQKELDNFIERLHKYRDLPKSLKTLLEMIPVSAHPMDVMRTGTSFLGNHQAQKLYPFKDKQFDLVISIGCLHNLRIFELETALKEIERVGKQGYIMLESYRNEKELFNLQCWALTCESFFDQKEWIWIYTHFGYTGDYEFIYFE